MADCVKSRLRVGVQHVCAASNRSKHCSCGCTHLGACRPPPPPAAPAPLPIHVLTSPGWLVRLHTASCCCGWRRERRGSARTAPRPRARGPLLLVVIVGLLLLLRRAVGWGARATRSCMVVEAAAHCIVAVLWK